MFNLKKVTDSFKYRRSNLLYYLDDYFRHLTPKSLLKKRYEFLKQTTDVDRLNYYNKLENVNDINYKTTINDFKRIHNVYFIDTFEYLRYFPKHFSINYEFGDLTTVPKYPSIVKSRPIANTNQNSVILNLEKRRHFIFPSDDIPFTKKSNRLIGRSACRQIHRIKFYELYFNHPMCDLGDISDCNKEWKKEFSSINDQRKFKFILCLEGFDVATNLKWVMASNSLAVMPKPKYETWFMEGKLISNHHYVEIKSDYSDLEERMEYYIDHPDEANQIIENAHNYITKFQNKDLEDAISIQVLEKYFKCTNQY